MEYLVALKTPNLKSGSSQISIFPSFSSGLITSAPSSESQTFVGLDSNTCTS